MKNFFYDSCLVFIESLVPGIFLGMIYDLFRIFRIGENAKYSKIGTIYNKKMPKKLFFSKQNNHIFTKKLKMFSKTSAVFFQDVVFWLFVGIVETIYIFQSNDGEIRLYSVFFTLVGFLLYYHTIGIIVMYFAKHIFLIVRLIFAWTCFSFFYPILQIFGLLKKVSFSIYQTTIVRWKQKILYQKQYFWSEQKKNELLFAAKEGFENL